MILNTEQEPIRNQFEVFFDGNCPMCKREIAMVRRKDKQNLLKLTDISNPDFDLPDRSHSVLMREIHGRYPDGTFVTGIEVFREIYQRIGFGFLVKPTRLPIVRHVLEAAYWVFAKFRFWLAMRGVKKRASQSVCKISQDGSTAAECSQIKTMTRLE